MHVLDAMVKPGDIAYVPARMTTGTPFTSSCKHPLRASVLNMVSPAACSQ